MLAPRLAVPALALALAACETAPPRVFSSLEASTELFAVNPADVAVLPIEDATPDGTAADVRTVMREEIAKALVLRQYTPLAPAKVDEVLSGQTPAPPAVSVVDAAWLRSVQGKFGEDATLGVRVTRWDRSSLMSSGHVRFAAEVTMVSTRAKSPLWSGVLEGEVKAGGSGPAPRDRAGRARSAAVEFAAELVRSLPRRRA